MQDEDKAYYIAAGRSLAAIEAWQAAAAEMQPQWDAFEAKYGGRVYCQRLHNGAIEATGMSFAGSKVPPGWRKPKKRDDYCVPHRKTKEGKAICREMAALTTPSLHADAGAVEILDGLKIYWPGAKKLGDYWLITHHAKAKPPLDARRLKASEYWKIIEEHGQLKSTEAA